MHFVNEMDQPNFNENYALILIKERQKEHIRTALFFLLIVIISQNIKTQNKQLNQNAVSSFYGITNAQSHLLIYIRSPPKRAVSQN